MFESLASVREIVAKVGVRPGVDYFKVEAFTDRQGDDVDAWFLQHYYVRPDAISGMNEYGFGRKWFISRHATKSEIVLTCLKAAITNAEHEVREAFTYDGAPIFQPHIDVDALVKACESSDARPLPIGASDRARGDILG